MQTKQSMHKNAFPSYRKEPGVFSSQPSARIVVRLPDRHAGVQFRGRPVIDPTICLRPVCVRFPRFGPFESALPLAFNFFTHEERSPGGGRTANRGITCWTTVCDKDFRQRASIQDVWDLPLFPLDGRRWLAANIQANPVNPLNFVDDSSR